MLTLNLLAREHVRGLLRRELAPQLGFTRALVRVAFLPDSEIDRHAEEAAVKVGADIPAGLREPAPGAVGKAFDGHILKEIIDWVQSPQGKAVISLLVTVLTALLMFA